MNKIKFNKIKFIKSIKYQIKYKNNKLKKIH